MSSLIWHVTMSLDGFIAGPDDSMDWMLADWSGGERARDVEVERSVLADRVLQGAGAILGGRRWYDVAVRDFDGYDGIYGGRWGGPVFVLSHRPPDPGHHPAIEFLSGDVADAVGTATTAAEGGDVVVFGASLARQCLRAGMLDEIAVHLAPVLLGAGVRLVEGQSLEAPVRLERTYIASSGQLTDVAFAVRNGA